MADWAWWVEGDLLGSRSQNRVSAQSQSPGPEASKMQEKDCLHSEILQAASSRTHVSWETLKSLPLDHGSGRVPGAGVPSHRRMGMDYASVRTYYVGLLWWRPRCPGNHFLSWAAGPLAGLMQIPFPPAAPSPYPFPASVFANTRLA